MIHKKANDVERLSKLFWGGVILLVLVIAAVRYTDYAESDRIEQGKIDFATSIKPDVLKKAKEAFSQGKYAEVRQLLGGYTQFGDADFLQLSKNADKAEVFAYQLEQSDFYKKNPPVKVDQWSLKTGGINYSYSFTDTASSYEQVGVEFNHDKTGKAHVSVMWHGSNISSPATLTIEREQFIIGLVNAIFPQIEIPKLIAYIRANQNKSSAKGWDALPRAEINGVRVYVGVDSPNLMVGFGGGTSEELLKVIEPAPQQSTEQSGNSSTFHSNDIPGGPSVNSKTGDLSEEQLDGCFLSGESAATAYISDMAKYANSGLMPSTVMEKGCERKGNETADPKACIQTCEMGFRKVAKDVLNGR
ncbi:MAG: hypothetical protein NTY60_02200 [Proteobacteria bacterium]|nr:hypothetical protein [Pseudomonadota bacterium]